MALRFDAVTVDSLDAEALATFWAALLGVDISTRWHHFVVLGIDPHLMFQQVDEKPEHNSWHPDLHAAPGEFDLEVARAVSLGATVVETQELDGQHWQIMADPEGNVFCIVRD